jgi:NTE family protein
MISRSFVVFILFILNFPIFGQDTTIYKLDLVQKRLPFNLTYKDYSNKPFLGLVLSGGGSRGLSQIGVLKAFEEKNVPIDYIIGTSMGSIVGGMYSSGYSIKQIDSIVSKIDWNDFFSANESNRRELFIEQKITEDKAIFSLRFDGLKPVIPISIATGQKVANFLSLLEFNAPIHFVNSFDNLLYKYRAVATDLVYGRTVLLSNGSLGKAMRASSSISLLLSPVKIDTLLLVDGGLVANVPANIAKNLGCDLIVAVNATSPLNNREELAYPWNIADQMVSIPMRIISNKHIENADFLITPDLGNLKNSDFSKIRSSISEGYFSALQIVDSINSAYKQLLTNSFKLNDKPIRNFLFLSDDIYVKQALEKYFSGVKEINLNDLMYAVYSIFNSGNYKDLWFEHVYDLGNNKFIIYSEYNPTIKKININGVSAFSSIYLDSLFLDLKDKPYNSKIVLKKILILLQKYRSLGFSLAEIDEVGFDENSNELSIKVKEGKIDKIILEGNNITNDDIILREFSLKEGDFFVYSKIEKGLIGLRSTNFFEDIDISITKENELNCLIIKVIERNPAILRFGFKIDNENQAQISLDLRDENVYGTGTELGFLFWGGIRNRSFLAEYKANRIFRTYFTYKLKGYYDITDINYYIDDTTRNDNKFKRIKDSEYRQIINGVSLGIGTQAGKLGNFIVEGRYETNEIKNKVDYKGSTFKTNIVAVKFDLTIDSQDRFPYPRNGFYVKSFYETAQKNFGSDVGYTKLYNYYATTFTINNVHTISNKFVIGFGDETLPLSQQFTLGGQNSFFGYRENEFRGRQIMLTSLEYRYFLPFKLFFDSYVKIRYDLGSIWSNKQEIKFKDLKHGIGATVSLDTPIGPADFSVGRSFYFRQSNIKNILVTGEVFFYFNIGYVF